MAPTYVPVNDVDGCPAHYKGEARAENRGKRDVHYLESMMYEARHVTLGGGGRPSGRKEEIGPTRCIRWRNRAPWLAEKLLP